MRQSGGHSGRIISAAIFILLEVAALSMLSRSSTLQDIWMNRLSHRTMGILWNGGESIRGYFSLKEQNERLASENFELNRRILAYEREKNERECIEASPQEQAGFRYIPATIVKMSRNTRHNYLILDKGSEDGVLPQSGIITGSGVVGIVSSVDKHYSYALSFFNPQVVVSARIGRGGTLASLSWDGHSRDKALMHELPLHIKVTPGDTIWTSGYSTLFPPDIPIGKAGELFSKDGSGNELEVSLLQDFSLLRYVTVVENCNSSEIATLEKKEDKQ